MRIKWFSLVRITGLVLVLLYHFFKDAMPGGFIGVDVFFTFSGYLITALLIDEFAKNKKIDYLAFLRRRFYRIVPPLVLMILLTIPFALLVRHDYLANIGQQIAAAIGFMTNYFEILTGGNYESNFIPHLFLHTWSLAVEVHFYVIWAFVVWLLAKVTDRLNRFRAEIFMISAGWLIISGLSMFIGSFLVSDFSRIYFSSLTHTFPFFLGAMYATMTGINDDYVLERVHKNARLWSPMMTFGVIGGSLLMLLLLGRILDFNGRITYLFGFGLASLFTGTMIYGTRILHEQTLEIEKEPFILTFLSDISYGIYLFHWPLYTIFTEMMGNTFAVILTMIFSIFFSGLSFYIIEPILAGHEDRVFGGVDSTIFQRSLYGVFGLLAVLTGVVIITSPGLGDFERGLLVDSLNQADTKMHQTNMVTAGDSSAISDVTIIGDSVALRSQNGISSALPESLLDAAVSRDFDDAYSSFMNYLDSGTLSSTIVIAIGVNDLTNYEAKIQQFIDQLPDGHRLVFVTPYSQVDYAAEVKAMRDYELELASQYDFVEIADWYQTAVDNPDIWKGTDGVHYVDTNDVGRTLYAETIRDAVNAVSKKLPKGGVEVEESTEANEEVITE